MSEYIKKEPTKETTDWRVVGVGQWVPNDIDENLREYFRNGNQLERAPSSKFREDGRHQIGCDFADRQQQQQDARGSQWNAYSEKLTRRSRQTHDSVSGEPIPIASQKTKRPRRRPTHHCEVPSQGSPKGFASRQKRKEWARQHSYTGTGFPATH
ncbi:uncharacterized protein BCR38DRAFT_408783 [Pseudomassariella vexata]|uniref:Uncharacterized protein n=1 Tax=Pseudomassariella vexata TaxID=1141098 RepID=A0A1Y2E0G4_9PEZI|nr:uncharacterized protein BCR38DRAFT_408783 [Pseudomassariella vexata]ORY65038.1 hypothetical protein BCR38DRAFT_408783 [Pseudomassariella vexata]